MIIKGASIKGAIFEGGRTLASIGNIIWWFDYRNLVELDVNSRVTSWASLASNYNINRIEPPSAAVRPYFYSDGIGRNPADVSLTHFTTNQFTETFRQLFLTQTPFVIFVVGKKISNGSGSNAAIDVINIRNTGNTTNVFTARVAQRNGGSTLVLDAESELGLGVTDNEFILMQLVYYGDQGGANNVRIKNKTTSTSSVNSASIIGAGPSLSTMFMTANVTDALTTQRVKFSCAYNLSGKTVSEIDIFCSSFEQILKEDSEYSTLST